MSLGFQGQFATALGNVSTAGINVACINSLAAYVNAVTAASDAADAAYAAIGCKMNFTGLSEAVLAIVKRPDKAAQVGNAINTAIARTLLKRSLLRI